MRALIFSDSHGDEANLRWMAELAAQRGPMDAYIHCGDGARDFDRLANFLLGLSPQAALYGVKGNCDLGVDAPVQRVVHLGGMGILITHGHLQAVKLTLGALAPAAREAKAAAPKKRVRPRRPVPDGKSVIGAFRRMFDNEHEV